MKVFLTVDVECYSGDYEREVWAAGLGLEYIVEQLVQHALPATFFVEALGATQWGTPPLARICRYLLEADQRVELHLHPSVARLEGFQDRGDVLWEQDRPTQARLLKEGIRQLKLAGASEVTAFRAGDLAANGDTLAAMRDVGVQIGSNRDLCLKSSIRSRVNNRFPAVNDISESDGIVDIPVSCLRSPLGWVEGPYRHLQVCAISSREMCWGLDRLARAGFAAAGILTHPPEFFRWKDGHVRPLEKNRQRFECLLRFLSQRSDMEACVIDSRLLTARIPDTAPDVPALPLHMSVPRMMHQAAFRVRHGAK